MVHMQYKGLKGLITKTVTAGLLASLYLGWGPQQVLAAPVITNMPHRADGSRITGSQPVPKTMPGDVAVKTKPAVQAAPKAETPKAEAPKTEAPKPVTPTVQTTPKVETPKAETPKVETPKPVTPTTQTTPKVEMVHVAASRRDATIIYEPMKSP